MAPFFVMEQLLFFTDKPLKQAPQKYEKYLALKSANLNIYARINKNSSTVNPLKSIQIGINYKK